MAVDNEVHGRKVFFVHPSAFLQNVVIPELIQQEFEVYIIREETKFRKILRNYSSCIIFASIDEVLSGQKWEVWIREVMGDQNLKGIDVGILTSANNDDSKRLYVNTLGVSCGYIYIKLDKTKVIEELLSALNAAGAKGRRKYIRADTMEEKLTTANLHINNEFVNAKIRDISVVGMACTFDIDPELEKNALLHDVQIKLQGVLVKVEAIVFGFRMDGPFKIYVFLFTAKTAPTVRAKIRTHIQKKLQSKMDEELKYVL